MHTLADRIRSKEFTRPRKGYDAAEVAAFLDRVADDVTELEAELRKEGVRANALERRVQTPLQAEGNVEAAFLAAAESKQQLLDEAQDRVQKMVADARREAARLVEVPKSEALQDTRPRYASQRHSGSLRTSERPSRLNMSNWSRNSVRSNRLSLG
ncbi:MAG: DivIVA domain-containing protein [Actinomycetota bacterium]|nr:DivIVA domain-containing protein [Actinomycetota bacterium]MDK1017257.1 DivIVA domain-containing protein [Actinomycetota bacterium]MDK1025716.1 DivIVA domain-containing protein [Actinomycetota bacterium]MDK1037626.1 DivIVA domain-containing protein [Actinomycetota bacterium]MDK1095685.1 DivIVA domain-containing protein [Actinomycetota bacterium]